MANRLLFYKKCLLELCIEVLSVLQCCAMVSCVAFGFSCIKCLAKVYNTFHNLIAMAKKEKLQHRILQNTSLILIIVSLIIAIVPLVSCSTNVNPSARSGQTDDVAADIDETMYQVSTLQALLDGNYDGYITVGELRKHGDIGVGTFDKIDGEMIVVDGTVYQARYDGSVCVADDNLTVPFANITHFDCDTTITLPKVESMEDLTKKLNNSISLPSTGGSGRVSGPGRVLYVARMDIDHCESSTSAASCHSRSPTAHWQKF